MEDIIYINAKTNQIVPEGYPNSEAYVRQEMLTDNACAVFCDNTKEKCPWGTSECVFIDALTKFVKGEKR